MKVISGTGSVFYRESKKLWVAQYIETEDGVSKQKCIYGKTKDIVIKKLNKVMYDYHNDNYIRENGITLIDVLKQNREDKFAANLISESHYSRLEFVIREIENSDIGNLDITKITTRNLQDYFNSLINRYTDSTIKKVWECVKQGFEMAIDEKYILENPFRKVLKPKSRKDTKVLEALTLEEQTKLAKYLLESNLSQEKYKNVLLVQLYAGLRVGEVLALATEDIDFNKKIIYVRKTVTVDKDGYLVVKQGAKTYSGKREVPLDPILTNALKEQINYIIPNENNLLFTFQGKIIKSSTINTVLKRICKQLQLPNTISNHTLRHTFGTRCIESGMSPVVVQRIMGHKDIKVTLNTYTSVLNQFKNEEYNKVALYYLEKNVYTLPEETTSLNEPKPIILDNYNIQEETNIENFWETKDGILQVYRDLNKQFEDMIEDKEKYKKECKDAEILLNRILSQEFEENENK